MAKVTKVTLATVSEGAKREFEIGHAERILAMPRSGWELPEDSEWKYDNGTIVKRDKGKNK